MTNKDQSPQGQFLIAWVSRLHSLLTQWLLTVKPHIFHDGLLVFPLRVENVSGKMHILALIKQCTFNVRDVSKNVQSF